MGAFERINPLGYGVGWGPFSAGDVAQILGMSRRQVLICVEKDLVKPTIGSRGKGRARGFSILDILRVSVVAELQSYGAAPLSIKNLMNVMESNPISSSEKNPDIPRYLVFYKMGDDFHSYFARQEQRLLRRLLSKNVRSNIVVNLQDLFFNILEKAMKLRKAQGLDVRVER